MYDALVHGELGDELQTLFSDSQEADWETIAGYEIHAIDATPQERMSAETLVDRGVLVRERYLRGKPGQNRLLEIQTTHLSWRTVQGGVMLMQCSDGTAL